jgi:chemotaxis protein MotB
MMAFFMLMWLLNATTEKQRKGLADYFSPTIPVNRVSGGGDGALGGNSITADEGLPEAGTGATNIYATQQEQNRGGDGESNGLSTQELRSKAAEIDKILAARSGESMTMERALRHVTTKVTDEGLVIELFDLAEAPLFEGLTAKPETVLEDISEVLAEVLSITNNKLAVSGHVRSLPITLIDNPSWAMSAARAQALRTLLQKAGVVPEKIARISGFADRKPVTVNPMAIRNNRMEVILLRRDR